MGNIVSEVTKINSLLNPTYDRITLNLRLNKNMSYSPETKGFHTVWESTDLKYTSGCYYYKTNLSSNFYGYKYVVLLSELCPSNGEYNTINGHIYVYGDTKYDTKVNDDTCLYDLTDSKWLKQETDNDMKKFVEDFALFYRACNSQKGGGNEESRSKGRGKSRPSII